MLKARAWRTGLIPSGVTAATYTFGEVVTEPVVWTNGVNVTAMGSDLSKREGNASAWDAGAVSTRGIVSMDGYVEFTASETTTHRMIGLSRGDTNQGYPDIDFALYLASGGTLYVYEAGVNRGSFGTYVSGDRLRVAVEGGVVRYRRNGQLLYESRTAPVFPLLVDTSLYNSAATLRGVVLSGKLVEVAVASPVFSLPTGHYTSVQAVVVTVADPAATVHYTTNGVDPTESDAAIGSGASVAIEQDTVLKARAWRTGLIPSGVTAATYTFGEVVTEPVVWTNGVNVTAVGSDLSKREGNASAWDAGAVSTRGIVSMDGYVELTASETTTHRMIGLSRGDTNQGYPDIDFALYLASGGTVYVYEAGVNRGSFGPYVIGDRLRVAVEGGVVRYRRNGQLLYESGTAPVFPLLVDASLYNSAATLRGVVLSGRLVEVAVASPVFSLPTGHYASAQAVVVVTVADPAATVHYTTNGVDPTKSDLVVVSGEPVLIEQDTVLKARAWRTGLIPSGVTAATYTFGEVVTEPVVWTNGVNVTAAENELAKSRESGSAWNAGAVSTQAIVSMDGYVEVVASETTTHRMIGLSRGDTNQGYPDIDFALYLASGRTLYVYEAGVNRGSFGTYVSGDLLARGGGRRGGPVSEERAASVREPDGAGLSVARRQLALQPGLDAEGGGALG